MTELLATPIDELTGLPLPISVGHSTLHLPGKGAAAFSNEHHGFHPARDLTGRGIELAALRQTRIQVLPNLLHIKYHETYYGPPLPLTEDQIYRATIFAVLRHIPHRAIAFNHDGETFGVSLSKEQREQMWKNQVMRTGDVETIQTFLLQYLAQNGLEDTHSGLVDELLHTQDTIRRMTIGRRLIRDASWETTASFSGVYVEAKTSGRISDKIAKARRIGNFVCDYLTLAPKRGVNQEAIGAFIGFLRTAIVT